MKPTRQCTVPVLFLLLVLAAGSAAGQESTGVLYQEALYVEEVAGDLDHAVQLYRSVLAQSADDRWLAAKAQLGVARCASKRGDKAAHELYRAVLREYPDQHDVVTIARGWLARFAEGDSSDTVVQYYFHRIGVDIMAATSPDGESLAFTDWTTGGLMVKDLATGATRTVVTGEWPGSRSFPLRPVWTRDGSAIAYGWYRDHRTIELRVTRPDGETPRAIHAEPNVLLSPQDWSPDGASILCLLVRYPDFDTTWLVVVPVGTGSMRTLAPITRNSRGHKFSPDGRFIAYDEIRGGDRHIVVLALETLQRTQVSSGLLGEIGNDAPVWDRDGSHLLYRSHRRGEFDLWSIPMRDGSPTGVATLVQPGLTAALLRIKKVRHPVSPAILEPPGGPAGPFREEFDRPLLEPPWSVYEWKSQNVYGYRTFGRWSLSARPGYLRFFLDPIMGTGVQQSYMAHFSGWYWSYPALELSRPLSGDAWTLEARVMYTLVDGAQGRGFTLVVYLDPERDRETALVIERSKEMPYHNHLSVMLLDRGIQRAVNDRCLAAADSIGVPEFTYTFRITRDNTALRVALHEDGTDFREVLSTILRSDLSGKQQIIGLSGFSWFVPAGSHADWDYVRFTPEN